MGRVRVDKELDSLRSKIAELEGAIQLTSDQAERTAMRYELAAVRQEKAVLMRQQMKVSMCLVIIGCRVTRMQPLSLSGTTRR